MSKGAILGEIRRPGLLKWRGSLYRPALPEKVALVDPCSGPACWGVAKR
jgi:hypothetical protein